MENVCLFGLPSGYNLAKKIAFYLKKELSILNVSHFQDGEIIISSQTSVRGKDIFLVQSTCTPVNEKLMELLITIDSFKRAGAKSINVIAPYLGYSRQDRKSSSREPITCKLVANMISVAGATALLTVDIHSLQTIGFFDIVADSITTTYHFYKYLKNYFKTNTQNEKYSLIAPDHGSLPRVLKLFNLLKNSFDVNFGFIDKRRNKPNEVELGFVLGDVQQRHCFIIDDLIDTGGTIIQAAKALKNNKALDITILATHGLFSGPSIERFDQAYEEKLIKSVIITDTIPLKTKEKLPWLETISLAYFLSKLIQAFVGCGSLTSVYQDFISELK